MLVDHKAYLSLNIALGFSSTNNFFMNFIKFNVLI